MLERSISRGESLKANQQVVEGGFPMRSSTHHRFSLNVITPSNSYIFIFQKAVLGTHVIPREYASHDSIFRLLPDRSIRARSPTVPQKQPQNVRHHPLPKPPSRYSPVIKHPSNLPGLESANDGRRICFPVPRRRRGQYLGMS